MITCHVLRDFLLKVKLLHGCFSRFLNCTNGTKSRKKSQTYNKFKELLSQRLKQLK